MRGTRLSIALSTALATFAATLFVTSLWAATPETVLHNFNNNGTDGTSPQPAWSPMPPATFTAPPTVAAQIASERCSS